MDKPEDQASIIASMHDESGHRGREGTWRKVWHRYFWPRMFQDVDAFVRSCPQCQFHSAQRFDEELHPTRGPNGPWEWVTVDVVYMPVGLAGKKFLVVARDYMSGYPEARALAENSSAKVAKFLEEDIFARWGVPLKISVDGGPENKGLVEDMCKLYGVNRVVASAFHPQAQGLIERGHKELTGALRKMTGNWVSNLHLALWADRVTTKRSTVETPAYLMTGREHVLPVELCIPTWQTLPWNTVRETSDLIALRAKQFEHRDDRLREAVDRTVRLREDSKEWFDSQASFRAVSMTPGDLVLIRDALSDIDISRAQKLRPRWKGPFRIARITEKGTYFVEELDGTPLKNTFAGSRLKKFVQRKTLDLDVLLDLNEGLGPANVSSPATPHDYVTDLASPLTAKPRVQVRIPRTDVERSEYVRYDMLEEEISDEGFG